MGLEVHVLDLGDIELDTSFLVLAQDPGRRQEVPTFGFLITGGDAPVGTLPGLSPGVGGAHRGHGGPPVPSWRTSSPGVPVTSNGNDGGGGRDGGRHRSGLCTSAKTAGPDAHPVRTAGSV